MRRGRVLQGQYHDHWPGPAQSVCCSAFSLHLNPPVPLWTGVMVETHASLNDGLSELWSRVCPWGLSHGRLHIKTEQLCRLMLAQGKNECNLWLLRKEGSFACMVFGALPAQDCRDAVAAQLQRHMSTCPCNCVLLGFRPLCIVTGHVKA